MSMHHVDLDNHILMAARRACQVPTRRAPPDVADCASSFERLLSLPVEVHYVGKRAPAINLRAGIRRCFARDGRPAEAYGAQSSDSQLRALDEAEQLTLDILEYLSHQQ